MSIGVCMGVLLVLAVLVLAFLCGRLQVTVGALTKRLQDMEMELVTLEKFGNDKE